jgi:hypothetical protein
MMRKTIIITGVVDHSRYRPSRCPIGTTERLIRDLDEYCDSDTHIVLSTWEGQKINTSDIKRCDVIFSKDPGPGPPSQGYRGRGRGKSRRPPQNFNRQLCNINAGLRLIEQKYEPSDRGIVLRIRSDFKCNKYIDRKNPFSVYNDIPVTDKEVSNLSNKIWIDSSYFHCRDGRISENWSYNISDWSCMGRYEDLREWFNIKKESVWVAPGVWNCEHTFFVSNVVKCRLKETSNVIMDGTSMIAKRFLDENVVFYSLETDLGMTCVRFPHPAGRVTDGTYSSQKSISPRKTEENL